MRLFLTHVDTPYRMHSERMSFSDPRLMLSASDLAAYDEVTAICAYWCDHRLSDEEGWQNNLDMRADAKEKLAGSGLRHFYSVEDARIVGGDPLLRLKELYEAGVRVLTPMWYGVNRLGGAFNTDVGLTDDGRYILSAAMEMGIVPDISHANETSAGEILTLAKAYHTPVLATHSCFHALSPHPRNLSDRVALRVAESGGMIGLCLLPEHVGMNMDLAALLAHYKHAEQLGIVSSVCLGTDLDGTDTLVTPLKNASDLRLFADYMRENGYDDIRIDDLFYNIAHSFFSRRYPEFF